MQEGIFRSDRFAEEKQSFPIEFKFLEEAKLIS